jgi:hypothetical protein
MKNHWTEITRFSLRMVLVPVLAACFSSAAIADGEIKGSVRNHTRGRASPGDEVILLRLDPGAQEEASTITDVQGTFAFKVQHPGQSYLVRVVHQNVSYDRQASAGDSLSIQVFDTAPQVRGITGTIEILRAGTSGNRLHVSDMIEVTNQSHPPVTLGGGSTFEVYVPANAKIDSVLAAGPDKISVMLSATPVSGEPGHYAVNFPLRPGATKFAFNYDLPYPGHAVFRTKLAYPMQQFAVMLPSTMKFSSPSSSFQILDTGDTNYRVHVATQLKAGQGLAFEVSGEGALPSLAAQAKSLSPAQSRTVANPPVPASLPANLRSAAIPASSLQHTRTSSQRLALALTAALFAASVVLVWRVRRIRRI